MNDDAIYKAYCAKYNKDQSNKIFWDIMYLSRPEISKTWSYLKFKYSIRIYAFYLVFRMPFIVGWVKIKRLFR
jgi:hypothetical protein